jgi:hypothetical protein
VNTLRIGVVLFLAVAAAVVANVVLLGVATGPNDPVGKLSPRAGLIRLPSTTPTAPATSTVTTTKRTTPSDDGKSRGHGQDD